ncbi:hypothetical protein BDW59DRAFT_165017 [Aspergillus cavernicola]|uniref:Uncharacterized protein n=1 Tax=Aspergillus cavernicola TaxID=176166 RepID=A0ABR4HVQ5_9EURO
MTKKVEFAPYAQIIPGGSLTPVAPPTEEPSHDIVPFINPCSTAPRVLNIQLLATITTFHKYAGCIFSEETHNRPSLLFRVVFLNGTRGTVQCGEIICGEPASIQESFLMHRKIRAAKDLVGDKDWNHLKRRFGCRMDNIMQFEWLNQMRGAGFGMLTSVIRKKLLRKARERRLCELKWARFGILGAGVKRVERFLTCLVPHGVSGV